MLLDVFVNGEYLKRMLKKQFQILNLLRNNLMIAYVTIVLINTSGITFGLYARKNW